MEKDYITIQESNLESAHVICSSISDADKRNRAVANVLAAKIAAEYFDPEMYYTDTELGLHNVAKILEDIDISDIYVNGAYVDVRVYFSEDEICVPKIHFDYGITPVVYMFIQLNRDLSDGTVTGFMLPENIDKSKVNDNYYYISEDSLSSYYDIENHLLKVLDTFEGPNDKIYEYIEGTLNQNDTVQLFRTFIVSESARKVLLNAVKAQTVFNMVSVPAPVSEEEISEIPEVQDVQEDAENFAEFQQDVSEPEPPQEQADLEMVADAEALFDALEYSTEVTPSSASIIEEVDNSSNEEQEELNDNEEQIEALFDGTEKQASLGKKGKSNALLPLIFIVLVATLGYFGYKWYLDNYTQNSGEEVTQELAPPIQEVDSAPVQNAEKTVDAMPNETVEKTTVDNTEEGNSVAIPAIEKNLDASVLVSNLKVDWEVPAAYSSNSSARYYLVRLGKIIQLNLKSELLLLSKPPISNRITVELTYNQGKGKFDVVGIKDSSGEKSVDDVIIQTIKTALATSLASNTEIFEKLQGNPVIIIHL